MRVYGMMRVKNEARWIERCVRSILPLCHQVHVLDDTSTDDTAMICRSIDRVVVHPSPFDSFQEVRDKNYLLDLIRADAQPPDWVIHIDGDEELLVQDLPRLAEFMRQSSKALTLKVLYLWDDDATVRTDGVYGRMKRPSAFRLDGCGQFASYNESGLHCTNVPRLRIAQAVDCGVRLLHHGYKFREDRIRKYNWYRSIDPNNMAEDNYRHIVQGDVPEVSANRILKHAGPLKLQPLT